MKASPLIGAAVGNVLILHHWVSLFLSRFLCVHVCPVVANVCVDTIGRNGDGNFGRCVCVKVWEGGVLG